MPNSLVDKLYANLSPQARTLIDSVRDHASNLNLHAYLVGGTVRDLLLNQPSLDVDITIEGDAVALAKEIAAHKLPSPAHGRGAGGEGSPTPTLKKTTTFGTATLVAGDFRLDLATARSETYTRPGALPKVQPSTIDADLLRRDFTINAIALPLSGGDLLDPRNGVADIKTRLIRVLHDNSFQDDATRIIRAIRYATRFDFRIEERTLDQITRDLSYLNKISGTRLRQELTRVFAEELPGRALTQLRDLGVLRAIHPVLNPDDRSLAAFDSIHGDATLAWSLLALNITDSDAPELVRRLALTRKQSEAVLAVPTIRKLATQLALNARASEVARHLASCPEPALRAYALAGDPEPARVIRDHLDHARTVRTILRGNNIVDLGITRGPDVADVLAHLRAARLDGEVVSREDEVDFVEAYLAREIAGFD